MFSGIRGRIIIILIAIAVAVGALIANGIKLGLDLRGGMHLALEVSDPNGLMTADQIRDATDQNLQVLRNRIDQFGVAEPLVQKVGDDRIIVELPGIDDEQRAREIIERQAFLEWQLVLPTTEFMSVVPRLDRAIARQLDAGELGTEKLSTADTAAPQDSVAANRQAVSDILFGRSDSAAASDTTAAGDSLATPPAPSERPLSALLLNSGREGEFMVAEQDVERVKQYLALPGVYELMPRNTELVWSARTEGQGAQLYRSLYFLRQSPFITGERLRDATAGRDPQFNKTIVTFELDRRGGRTFEDVTSQHINDRIAIVLDTLVHSAPIVETRIGASGRIDLQQAPMQEASDLALVLRAGALPAPLEVVEQRSVGPSLGADSVNQGMVAGIIGILLVVAMMIFYYRIAGVLAVAALGLYVLFMLGGLALIPGATLTAPGIAGIILSVGMAVDANVLIFERIREELDEGRSNRAAVEEGFKNAMSAIVDSNITTLITGLILYQVGTGPVRGFAVTLSIGIIASFFSAVYITRTFFLIYLDRKRASEPISI